MLARSSHLDEPERYPMRLVVLVLTCSVALPLQGQWQARYVCQRLR